MRYVIAYDIVDDARRARLAKILLDYGERVQYSVYEMDVERDELEELLQRAKAVICQERDNLLLYRLCASCCQSIRRMGAAPAISLSTERWVV